MQTLRFLVAALALGAIADWGSETFFWSAPAGPITVFERMLTVLAYAAAAGTALSAVILTGASGVGAMLLGGAILGFLVEGVVVGTMYDAFPFQIVWTPLAWHALITGVITIGLGRLTGYLPIWKLAAGWAAVGVFGGVWAQFWPLERGEDMPAHGVTIAYLVGLGLAVPVANVILDRLGSLPRPPLVALLALPGLASAIWLARFVSSPTPVVLTCPAMIGFTVLAMRHLKPTLPFGFGRGASHWWKHFIFLIAPLTTALIALIGWRQFGGLEVNVPIALVLGTASAVWWLWLVLRAVRRSLF